MSKYQNRETVVIKPFIYRFCQKSKEHLLVSSIANSYDIPSINVHVGCTLTPKDPHTVKGWDGASELVMVLVKDLYKRNDHTPLADLKGGTCPKTLKCHVTLGQLVENLAKQQSFPEPFNFARARLLVEEGGKDVATCLEAGFKQLKIRCFPDLKYRDVSGHKRTALNFTHFVEVHREGEEPSVEAQAMSLVGDLLSYRDFRVLSSSRLPKVFGFNLWKLHYIIPYRMVPTTGLKRNLTFQKKIQREIRRELTYWMMKNCLDDEELPLIHVSKAFFMPVATSKPWEPKEIAITNTDSSVKPGGVYKEYVGLFATKAFSRGEIICDYHGGERAGACWNAESWQGQLCVLFQGRGAKPLCELSDGTMRMPPTAGHLWENDQPFL
ncbi:hypothetical protein XENOCAPTIV_026541 [Xenoophorus captivus]|uniref:Uncharacterized protein n=1 Tax=Xenoophorus captivus TaxID=1517983 RepID=A0ABV0S691_9TELE